MTVELFDEMQVRIALKRKVDDAGGIGAFAQLNKLRPRDVELASQGLFTSRLLKSIGFERTIRYAQVDPSPRVAP